MRISITSSQELVDATTMAMRGFDQCGTKQKPKCHFALHMAARNSEEKTINKREGMRVRSDILVLVRRDTFVLY